MDSCCAHRPALWALHGSRPSRICPLISFSHFKPPRLIVISTAVIKTSRICTSHGNARTCGVQRYMAIVGGRLEGTGRMAAPLDGRGCLTHWVAEGATRSARHRWVTTVNLSPHTGALRFWHSGRAPSHCASHKVHHSRMCVRDETGDVASLLRSRCIHVLPVCLSAVLLLSVVPAPVIKPLL